MLRHPSRPLRLERLEMEGPREDEVLVRLVACGVCRMDIDFWEYGAAESVVLSHEGAGVGEQVGSAVKGVACGDHVVLSYQSCGRCPACKNGHPAHYLRF
ncbi:alcohol dehydrogenase catalytic domain-containing protein [Desulfocurvibacter africanus]|uniref:alcohol dehydrogenase catalytic domain-containing protein n=1 Tax=Desulfocurvibacter africanus TaxID=873 RepID=UPI003A4D34C0